LFLKTQRETGLSYCVSAKKELATGLGSIPSITNIMEFLSNSIVSGFVYDVMNFVIMKGSDCMKKEIMFLGLGVCGDMV